MAAEAEFRRAAVFQAVSHSYQLAAVSMVELKLEPELREAGRSQLAWVAAEPVGERKPPAVRRILPEIRRPQWLPKTHKTVS
jgi:hypothetical protein